MTRKYICLLGFSADAEEKIKEIVYGYSGPSSVSWVSANDKSLDGVVINASFLEAPQIQKYISLVNKPVVCVHTNTEGEVLAKRHNLISITLSGDPHIATWKGRLFGEEVPTSSNLADAVTLKQEPVASPQRNSYYNTSSTSATKDSNGDILRKIRQGAAVVLRATYKDSVTWIKPAEGIVYINYPRENVPGYDQWLWDEISESDIPAHIRQLKLDLWLFETIWQSSLDSTRYVSQKQYYQLVRWPQPLSRHGRTEALRLAATAQAGPVDFIMLQQKTGYPAERILRFMFATLYAGQIEEVVNYVEQPKEVVQLSATEEKRREEKRSLLQRFRAKLGL